MSQSREEKATEIQEAIRKILYYEWDPIGIAGDAPYGEYDAYIASVYAILVGSRLEQELVDFLFRTARDTIGVNPKSSEQMRPIAHRLLELDLNYAR